MYIGAKLTPYRRYSLEHAVQSEGEYAVACVTIDERYAEPNAECRTQVLCGTRWNNLLFPLEHYFLLEYLGLPCTTKYLEFSHNLI